MTSAPQGATIWCPFCGSTRIRAASFGEPRPRAGPERPRGSAMDSRARPLERRRAHAVVAVGHLVDHALAHLEGREPAAVDAARVDADLVRQVGQDEALWGVAEHDRAGQRVRGGDELVADPEQILVLLLGERAARADARV